MRRLFALMLACASPAAADGLADAKVAFEARDFAGAEQLWRPLAQAGEPVAQFGLGMLHDLGLGVARDPAQAFRWYLEAADRGHVAAAFNVAVMLDAGTGAPRDAAAASVWYGRAAARGHARARYNLGLLYETGDGVPMNRGLARAWYEASGLAAATDRLGGLADSAPGPLSAPDLLTAGVVADATSTVDLVWTAAPQPRDAVFLVEIAGLDAGGATYDHAEMTQLSALSLDTPAAGGRYAWRVSVLDAAGTAYAAAPWWPLTIGQSEGASLGSGRVQLSYAEADPSARRFAVELAADMATAGILAQTAGGGDGTSTTVSYHYAQDGAFARDVASLLPVLGPSDAMPTSASWPPRPGVVAVHLVGGPAD